GECPLTIRDGRRWLEGVVGVPESDALPLPERPAHSGTPAVELKEVWFKYDKSGPDVLRGLSFSAWPGELACILGGNATGKTTALSCIAGVRRHYRGSIRIGGRPLSDYRGNELYRGGVALLPQNPQALFNANRLIDDLREVASAQPKERAAALLEQVTAELGLAPLLGANPGDLSGGEQQKAALAKLLLLEPKLLLLDEPTKGLDAQFKEKLAGIFSSLTARGVCLVMVTHDIEFAAQYAHRCAMFFDGGVISEDEPVRFFSGNSFYTTAANRMSRGVFKNAVTSGDVVKLCGLNVKE
ncbi:MAG: ATP-binding cassette domain-containing protein, partial [Clostridia bacterium]|nr:ATP-binding cassette domain-containing protein [Clostridia bacterium]